MKQLTALILMGLILMLNGCEKKPGTDADPQGHTVPTSFTIKANKAFLEELPFSDQQDFKDAQQGLIASDADLRIKGTDDSYIWDQPAFGFIKGDAPASVNPSLWRQAKLNNIHGLFKVTEGIYQLRGFDLSNMSIIEGKSGWIVIDPLTAQETAARAMALARKHLGGKPVKAVIYTHSHIDHFGGVLGVISPEAVEKGEVRIIAPKGFMMEATSENIIAGIGMARRSEYQFGRHLTPSIRGHVDDGLGKTVPFGKVGILSPTDIVDGTPQEMLIDGVRFMFQFTPESEAPAEMTFYLPDMKAFCGAEIVSRCMHNLYTLRGAKVRDAFKWSGYIEEAIDLFGDVEIYFGVHNWPMWGNQRIIEFLKKQRDLYKYIHDQTIRLANAGFTSREISEQIELPDSLRNVFSSRGYYGTLRHNSKAVYQAYFGWYDGNPANLNPLPPREAAVRYIEYMEGAEKVMAKARSSFEKGEYRWVAEVLNHLVFAEPDHKEAKSLLARTYDQLGYQSESGIWRNAYLTAAYELRHGASPKGINLANMLDILKRTPISRFFDSMAVRLNGPDADGMAMVINIIFTDIGESYVLNLENAVLHHRKSEPDPKANATLKLTHDLFLLMLLGEAGIKDTLFSDQLETSGSRIDLVRFFMLFDKPEANFNIVVP
jgi:alkyl sulfatase BDS1-like metallo-beta-lactamase superfamily hydrolase